MLFSLPSSPARHLSLIMLPVWMLSCCAGRDLSSALQLRAPGTNDRIYGWYRRGWRCAWDASKALNHLHSKVCIL